MSVKTIFENIAAAIRERDPSATASITPTQMPQAILDIPGGSGVELLTEAEWNELTTEQKQALGLTAIEQYNSGFNRGILVNGAEYEPLDLYLPYSNLASIVCSAAYEDFDSTATTWGLGTNPVIFNRSASQYQSESAVLFDALNGFQGYLPLASTSSDFTIYVVAKGLAYASGDVIVVGSVDAWTNNRIINLYHRSGDIWRTSIYGSSDTDLIDTGGEYVVVALRSQDLKASWFASNNASRLNVNYTAHGTTFTFGYRSGVPSTNLAIKFIGMINTGETDSTITSNISALKTAFNIS